MVNNLKFRMKTIEKRLKQFETEANGMVLSQEHQIAEGQSSSEIFRLRIEQNPNILALTIYLKPKDGHSDSIFPEIFNPGHPALYITDLAKKYPIPVAALRHKTDPVQTYEEFIDEFFTELTIGVKTYLQPYLSGEKWEDIPFDWGGTR